MAKWDDLQAIIALFEEGQRQQQRTDEVLAQLEHATRQYAATTQALPVAIGQKLNANLAAAGTGAAKAIAANWTAANEHADKATKAYARAVRFDSLRVFGMTTAALLAITFFAWSKMPDPGTITALRNEEAALRARIAAYEQLDARAQPQSCVDQHGKAHLCIAVDERIVLKKKGFRAIRTD